jgi:beta-N-acetylhexosaminidase
VLRLKQRLPSWDELPSAAGLKYLAPAGHQQLADQTYAQSMTVIRDEAGLIPIKRPDAGRILVVTQKGAEVTQAADLTFQPDAFINALSRQLDAVAASDVAAIALPARPDDQDCVALQQQARQADVVILMTCNAHLASRITSTRAIVRAVLEAERPVIGVAVGNPYDAMALPEVRTWLATYDFLSPALEAAAQVLVGALPAPGTLPVTF